MREAFTNADVYHMDFPNDWNPGQKVNARAKDLFKKKIIKKRADAVQREREREKGERKETRDFWKANSPENGRLLEMGIFFSSTHKNFVLNFFKKILQCTPDIVNEVL